MEFEIPRQTVANDLVRQRDRLCDAVRYSIQQDTDTVIISKDKQIIPCHSSLLVLFSPLARLLSSVPCCATPTIILPDFPALHISKLIHILGCGQTIPGENVNPDIEIIEEIAQVLQISISDLSISPYIDNPLNLLIEMKQEANSLKIKHESISAEEAKVEASSLKKEINIPNIKEEIISVKEEVIEYSEYIEMGENIPKQEYGFEADQLLDVNISHNIEQSVQKEALEINAYDKEDFCVVRNDILDDKGKNEGSTNLEQCEYIEQNVTVKNPQQKNMLQAHIDIMCPMVQVTQKEMVNGKLKCSGILEPYKVCQFFIRGRCQRQNCEFLHPKDLLERERQKERKMEREKEWERDKQRKRVREQDRERDRDKKLYYRPLVPPKIDASCKYFLGNGCKFGMICRFRHDIEKKRARERSRERSPERRTHKNDSDDESISKEGDSSYDENVKKEINTLVEKIDL